MGYVDQTNVLVLRWRQGGETFVVYGTDDEQLKKSMKRRRTRATR